MSSNPSSVKKETKKNVAKTSRITLKSAYGRHAGQSSVNVARFGKLLASVVEILFFFFVFHTKTCSICFLLFSHNNFVVGIHKNEKLDLAHLPAPVKMVRDPPPETPDWLVEKNARRVSKKERVSVLLLF